MEKEFDHSVLVVHGEAVMMHAAKRRESHFAMTEHKECIGNSAPDTTAGNNGDGDGTTPTQRPRASLLILQVRPKQIAGAHSQPQNPLNGAWPTVGVKMRSFAHTLVATSTNRTPCRPPNRA